MILIVNYLINNNKTQICMKIKMKTMNKNNKINLKKIKIKIQKR